MQVVQRLYLDTSFSISSAIVKQAQTDSYIVDRLCAALAVLKECNSEAQREEYLIVLAAIAPVREAERAQHGMIRRVAERINIQRGKYFESRGQENRPRAFDRAISHREEFDKAGGPLFGSMRPFAFARPLSAGEQAMSRGRNCTVVQIDSREGTCILAFEAGGVKSVRSYPSLGCGKSGARLARPPLSLRPKPRETRRDEKVERAREKVKEFFDAQGATSPGVRDQVQRRLSVGLYETAQALILYSTYAALYAMFLMHHPLIKISFSVFKALRPWYVRRAKREVCLCKNCENFRCYKDVLHSLVKVCVARTTSHLGTPSSHTYNPQPHTHMLFPNFSSLVRTFREHALHWHEHATTLTPHTLMLAV